MIFALLRLLLVGFVVLSVVYLTVSLYSRSVRKDKLEREWDEENRTGDRDAYVRAGLEEYSHSLRRRLILLVYIVPLVFALTIFYLVNYG